MFCLNIYCIYIFNNLLLDFPELNKLRENEKTSKMMKKTVVCVKNLY